MSEELGTYKIQLEQVEVALAADPANQDLLKLKGDLEELIRLQTELDQAEAPSRSDRGGNSSKFDAAAHNWQIGDRCMARIKGSGKQLATIDGISHGKAAITFINSGMKEFIKLSELSLAPAADDKNYVFANKPSTSGGIGTGGPAANGGVSKKDWRAEKERRKVRAQKKEARRKAVESEQEKEKMSWKNFNTKAANKGFKGIKRVTASGSAADGPRGGVSNKNASVSSRTASGFGFTNRGNMDSLF
uniref:Tudor domain-containing protein n=1 Tax=Panagrellus redivivus TaxID=6233 RepID=A0A7E4VSQ4_PANRE